MNFKETLTRFHLDQVFTWRYFKDVIIHLEAEWLNFLFYEGTRFWSMTEDVIGRAIKRRNSFLPFWMELFEKFRRKSYLGAASIDNCIFCVLKKMRCGSIEETLTFKRPCWIFFIILMKILNSTLSTSDLTSINSSKICMALSLQINAKTNHSLINNFILFHFSKYIEFSHINTIALSR